MRPLQETQELVSRLHPLLGEESVRGHGCRARLLVHQQVYLRVLGEPEMWYKHVEGGGTSHLSHAQVGQPQPDQNRLRYHAEAELQLVQ